MLVKDFINAFGIEKLQGKEIQENGKKYKIVLSAHNLEYHSINNEDWGNSKERLNGYHSRGNYRFYAMDENEMCVWVYPSTEIIVYSTIKLLKIGTLDDGAQRFQSQLYVGKDTADFIMDVDGVMKILEKEKGRFDFYEYTHPYEIVQDKKDMFIQKL